MKLSTGHLPPQNIEELGLVCGTCVLSVSIVRDALAAIKNITAGEMKQYTTLLQRGTSEALTRLEEEAKKVGADGVYAIQFMTPQLAGGAAEVVAVGTAYKFIKQ